MEFQNQVSAGEPSRVHVTRQWMAGAIEARVGLQQTEGSQ